MTSFILKGSLPVQLGARRHRNEWSWFPSSELLPYPVKVSTNSTLRKKASAVYTLRREFYANCAPNPCFKRDQHFKTEFIPFATHEVRDA